MLLGVMGLVMFKVIALPNKVGPIWVLFSTIWGKMLQHQNEDFETKKVLFLVISLNLG